MPAIIIKIVRYGCDFSAARRISIQFAHLSSEPVQHSFSRYHTIPFVAQVGTQADRAYQFGLPRNQVVITRSALGNNRNCTSVSFARETLGQQFDTVRHGPINRAHHRPCHRSCDSYRQKCIVSPQIPTHLPSLFVSYIYSYPFDAAFPPNSQTMSLSVSSFPEPSAKPPHHQKRQKRPPSESENKRAFFGTLLSKGSVPFLKRIRHFAKVNMNVKGSVFHHQQHHPEKVSPSRSRHPSSVAASPIKSSGIVIDLIAVPHNGEYFPSSKSDEADATSVDALREPWPLPPTTPAALPFPSVTSYVSATPPPTFTTEDPTSRPPLQSGVQPPTKHVEIASVVDNSNSHNSRASAPSADPPAKLSRQRSRAMTSPTSATVPPFCVTVTAVSPTSHSPTAQFPAAPTSTEGRARSRSVSTNVKGAATTETTPVPVPALPSRPRHKSETSIGMRSAITLSPNDIPQAERRGRGKSSPTPPLPSGIPLPKQQPQERGGGDTRPKRPRHLSNSSSRSARASSAAGGSGGNLNVAPRNSEWSSSPQAPTKQQQQAQNQSLLTAHMLCMRSGSRPLSSTTHHTHLLSVSSRPSTAHAHAHAAARPHPSRAITATSLLVPRVSPEKMAAERLYATRPRPKTTDGASSASSSRPRTPSISFAGVRPSEDPHDRDQLPPQTPMIGLVDSEGRISRLPVPNAQVVVSRAAAAAAAAAGTVGSEDTC